MAALRCKPALAFVLSCLWLAGTAQAAEPQLCTLIVDAAAGTTLHRSGSMCAQRVSPASTFKLPLAVIGYDAGLLKDAHNPAWDYKPEYDAPERNRKTVDPTIWERDSVVWYSQEITRRLGAERFGAYVARLRYGNADVTGDPGKDNGLIRAWLGSSLAISPEEQAGFVRRLLEGTLPASVKAQEQTRAIVPVFEVDGWTVHGKTGSAAMRTIEGAPDPRRPIGWFVGWAEGGRRRVVFARLEIGAEPFDGGMGLKVRDAFLLELPQLLKN